MTVATNGTICYGILLKAGAELPWDASEWDGDIDTWWLFVNGFQPSKQVYEDRVRLRMLPDMTDADADEIFKEEWSFSEAHPLPVETVNVCSDSHPIYILASQVEHVARRGYPEAFDPQALTINEGKAQALIEFCAKYGIDTDGEMPKWWLSSYWES